MRRPERISIVLKAIPWFNFIQNNLGLPKMGKQLKDILTNIENNLPRIQREWILNPDMRLGQLLIALGIAPDSLTLWNSEEVDWMIKNDCIEPRDILFWGRNFTKTMKPLERTQWILIKDMDTDHIEAVVTGKNHPLNLPWCKEPYLTYFKNELKLRNGKKKVSNPRRNRRRKA